MDWTGGARRRFGGTKSNSKTQKQKAHFARARALLQGKAQSHHGSGHGFRRQASEPGRSAKFEPVRDDLSGAGKRAYSPAKRLPQPKLDPRINRSERIHGKLEFNTFARAAVSISSHQSSSEDNGQSTRSVRIRGRPASGTANQTQLEGTTEEERLLLANRRRLLARSDWLNLGSKRPAQTPAASAGEKSRIGKRRRIARPEKLMNAAEDQRAPSPLFQDHLKPWEPMMSGALPNDEIQVKIGTDAWGTQTHFSSHSHTPGRTSMRHPSTEFGPLSEESMLLGPDDVNDFDDGQVEPALPDGRSLAALAGSQMTRAFPTAQEAIREWQEFQGLPEDLQEGDGTGNGDHGAFPRQTPGSHASVSFDRESDDQQAPVHFSILVEADDVVDDKKSAGHDPEEEKEEECEDGEKGGGDDEFWRWVMRIPSLPSSRASMKAVGSGSEHATHSDPSIRPAPSLPAGNNVSHGPFRREHVSELLRDNRAEPAVSEQHGDTSTQMQSPSASLLQITHLAEQPARQREQQQLHEEDDDDALWRGFVIGSRDGSSSSSPKANEKNHGRALLLDSTSSNITPNVSGLGTSDRSTVGDDTVYGRWAR